MVGVVGGDLGQNVKVKDNNLVTVVFDKINNNEVIQRNGNERDLLGNETL